MAITDLYLFLKKKGKRTCAARAAMTRIRRNCTILLSFPSLYSKHREGRKHLSCGWPNASWRAGPYSKLSWRGLPCVVRW